MILSPIIKPRGRVLAVALAGVFLLSSFFCFFPETALADGLSISGKVFEDLNFNQTFDFGESELSGWKLNLYENNNLIAESFTDNLGNYSFFNLKSEANYKIKIILPEGWVNVSEESIYLELKQENLENIDFSVYQVIREEKNIGPIILAHSFEIKHLSPSSVEISWHTTHNSFSQVIYDYIPKLPQEMNLKKNGLNYNFFTQINFIPLTYHQVILTDLKPSTKHYYRVISLPDQRQWRGSGRIVSQEFSFITPDLPSGEDEISDEVIISEFSNKKEEKEEIKEKPLSQPLIEKIPEIEYISELKVSDFKSTRELAVEVESKDPSIIADLDDDEIQEQAKTAPAENCTPLIVILLIINAIIITIVRSFGKRTKNDLVNKLWLAGLILVFIPTIFGWPECWLINWIILILLVNLIILSGFKKKKPPVINLTPSLPEQKNKQDDITDSDVQSASNSSSSINQNFSSSNPISVDYKPLNNNKKESS